MYLYNFYFRKCYAISEPCIDVIGPIESMFSYYNGNLHSKTCQTEEVRYLEISRKSAKVFSTGCINVEIHRIRVSYSAFCSAVGIFFWEAQFCPQKKNVFVVVFIMMKILSSSTARRLQKEESKFASLTNKYNCVPCVYNIC